MEEQDTLVREQQEELEKRAKQISDLKTTVRVLVRCVCVLCERVSALVTCNATLTFNHGPKPTKQGAQLSQDIKKTQSMLSQTNQQLTEYVEKYTRQVSLPTLKPPFHRHSMACLPPHFCGAICSPTMLCARAESKSAEISLADGLCQAARRALEGDAGQEPARSLHLWRCTARRDCHPQGQGVISRAGPATRGGCTSYPGAAPHGRWRHI
jgi:hypothetical protein